MRREASAISESELDRRLQLPPADDELARLGSTLNSLLARLEEAFRKEARFLDQASHELRTPLAVLKMELDLAVAEAKDPRELREALLNASAEADRLVRLAEDLLVLARLRDGRLPVRRTPVDMRELVGSVCAAHERLANVAGARIEWTATSDVVLLDPSRVRQAIEDLLDNAVRHGGVQIEVSANMFDGGVEIVVRDRGPGFPPEMLERPLEPFSRRASQEGDRMDGPGLGLSIVRAVAEAHGGSVSLRNRPSGGATVTLFLAVPSEGASEREGHLSPGEGLGSKGAGREAPPQLPSNPKVPGRS